MIQVEIAPLKSMYMTSISIMFISLQLFGHKGGNITVKLCAVKKKTTLGMNWL